MSEFLVVEGLTKSFHSGGKTLRVLNRLSLKLRVGQMLAVTGASGSGKSTFLHLVGAMEPADRGSILFEGREIVGLSREKRAEFRNREIGFIFQFHHLLPEFTARENVMMPLLLRGTDRFSAGRQADHWLGEVGLELRRHHRPGQLSGGEQQRVAVARALVGQPRLLLADEPTGNLDDRTSEAVQQMLLEIHRRNQLTSIMVTHDPSLAALCQRQTRMETGVLVEQ